MNGEQARTAYASVRAFALDRPGSMIAALLLGAVALAAFAAPLIAPQNPFDLASFDVLDANVPPLWLNGSDPRFLLGTDAQGRDLLSAILYGTRISLTVGVLAVGIQAAIGVPLGLIGGVRRRQGGQPHCQGRRRATLALDPHARHYRAGAVPRRSRRRDPWAPRRAAPGVGDRHRRMALFRPHRPSCHSGRVGQGLCPCRPAL